MKFRSTPVHGAFLIEPERREDDRGFFARVWCRREFEAHGLNPVISQANLAFNERKGTLRGLHFQRKPHEEAKVVRCTAGEAHDVVLDLRRDSPTYRTWFSARLSAQNRTMVYVPEGCAHGIQALRDETEVHYFVSEPHAPESEDGVRWDDPAFSFDWPVRPPILSSRDRAWPDLPEDRT